MIKEYLGVIAQAALFRNIDKEQIGCMIECLSPNFAGYGKNELLALSGQPFSGIGLLIEGEAAIIKETFSGDRIVINIIGPGDMFGEMIAFSNQSVWPATVQAQVESKAIFIPREKIIGQCERLCPWHRTLIQNLLQLVSNRALMLNKKLEYLAIKSMRGRISAFLLDQYQKTGCPTFTLNMNRNELADFLNVSRPSMSREMGRMKEEGIIDFHLSSVRVKDPEALKNYVK